jgi:hypothetical protein
MEKVIIGTVAGAVMLSLGIALGGGVVPVGIFFLAVGCVAVCGVFAYALVVILEGNRTTTTTTRIVEYREEIPGRQVYRVEEIDLVKIPEGRIVKSTQLVNLKGNKP